MLAQLPPELVTHIALQCNDTTDGFANRCALRGSATVARHIPVLPCVRGTTELDVSDLLLYADLRGKQHIWAFHLQARRYVRIGTDPALLKRNIDSKPCPSARFYWPDNLFVWLPKSAGRGFWVCHDAETLDNATVNKTFEEHNAPATTLDDK